MCFPILLLWMEHIHQSHLMKKRRLTVHVQCSVNVYLHTHTHTHTFCVPVDVSSLPLPLIGSPALTLGGACTPDRWQTHNASFMMPRMLLVCVTYNDTHTGMSFHPEWLFSSSGISCFGWSVQKLIVNHLSYYFSSWFPVSGSHHTNSSICFTTWNRAVN